MAAEALSAPSALPRAGGPRGVGSTGHPELTSGGCPGRDLQEKEQRLDDNGTGRREARQEGAGHPGVNEGPGLPSAPPANAAHRPCPSDLTAPSPTCPMTRTLLLRALPSATPARGPRPSPLTHTCWISFFSWPPSSPGAVTMALPGRPRVHLLCNLISTQAIGS